MIKKLPRDTKGWFVDLREPGALYLDDPVTKIDGVKGAKQKLLAKNGVNAVGVLMGIEDTDIQRIAKDTRGLSVPGLTAIVGARRAVLGKNAPEAGYYLNEENPFATKYTREAKRRGLRI